MGGIVGPFCETISPPLSLPLIDQTFTSTSVSLRAAMDPEIYTSMEEILIDEVRQRPSLFDKTTAMYRCSRIREQEWKEVAKILKIQDVEAVKKRWRTLRDSFIKICRTTKHNPKQVVKWIYYKKMLFLIPHIESREIASDEWLQTRLEDSETQDPLTEADSNSDTRLDDEQHKFDNGKNKKRSFPEDPTYEPIYYKKKVRSDDDEESRTRLQDADEQFLLSCLPTLQRLKPRENAIARMRIQQVLFDIEFGEEERMGIVTKIEEVEEDLVR